MFKDNGGVLLCIQFKGRHSADGQQVWKIQQQGQPGRGPRERILAMPNMCSGTLASFWGGTEVISGQPCGCQRKCMEAALDLNHLRV